MALTGEQISAMDAAAGEGGLSPEKVAAMDAASGAVQPGIFEDIANVAKGNTAKAMTYLATSSPSSIASDVIQNTVNPVVRGVRGLEFAAGDALFGDKVDPEQKIAALKGIPEFGQGVMQTQVRPLLNKAIAMKTQGSIDPNYVPQTGLGEATDVGMKTLPYLAGGEAGIGNAIYTAAKTGSSAELAKKAAEVAGFDEKGQQIAEAMGGGLGVMSGIKPAQAPEVDIGKIKQNSQDLYQASDQMGGGFSAAAHNKFIDDINNHKDIKPSDIVSSNWGLDDAQKFAQGFEASYGKELPLSDAVSIDKKLTDKIWENTEQNGKVNDIGRKYSIMQQKLRGLMDNAKPEDLTGGTEAIEAHRTATQVYAAQRKLDMAQKIIDDAQYSDNPTRAIQSGFIKWAKSDKKLTGLSNGEVAAIKDAAKNGIYDKALKVLGTHIAPGVGALFGSAVGGEAGLAAGAAAGGGVEALARAKLAERQMAKANNVMNTIADRPAVKNASDILQTLRERSAAKQAFAQPAALLLENKPIPATPVTPQGQAAMTPNPPLPIRGGITEVNPYPVQQQNPAFYNSQAEIARQSAQNATPIPKQIPYTPTPITAAPEGVYTPEQLPQRENILEQIARQNRIKETTAPGYVPKFQESEIARKISAQKPAEPENLMQQINKVAKDKQEYHNELRALKSQFGGSLNPEKLFIEKDYQGSTPEVMQKPSENPDWFKNELNSKSVNSTIDAIIAGRKLGKNQVAIEKILKDVIAEQKKNSMLPVNDMLEHIKADPYHPLHESAVMGKPLPEGYDWEKFKQDNLAAGKARHDDEIANKIPF